MTLPLILSFSGGLLIGVCATVAAIVAGINSGRLKMDLF